jgi:hypothetical protein
MDEQIRLARQEAFERGVLAGRHKERDYVLQFVVDHEFSNVPITGRDVADELTYRTKQEMDIQVNAMMAK